MLVAARRARGDVEKSIAGSSLDVHSLDFQPNPIAPAGNSMGRLRTWLEDIAERKQGKEKCALERSDSHGSQSEGSGGSGVEIVHGLVGRSGPKKLKTVQPGDQGKEQAVQEQPSLGQSGSRCRRRPTRPCRHGGGKLSATMPSAHISAVWQRDEEASPLHGCRLMLLHSCRL